MLSDLLDFLLQVSIWGTDNEVFSKRTQRVFQGIILLFLIAFAAVGCCCCTQDVIQAAVS